MGIDRNSKFKLAVIAVEIRVPVSWTDTESQRWYNTKLQTLKEKMDVTAEEYRDQDVEITVKA